VRARSPDVERGSDFEVGRTSTLFPRGGTLDFVCLKKPADLKVGGSDNVKNGTSAARGLTHPERDTARVRGRVVGNSKFKIEN
jgi:hypothetical protein